LKKVGVLTSGGDAPGMNAAIRAVVRGALHKNLEVYGIQRGYEGLINKEVIKLSARSVSDTLQRGGTWLRTARSERFKLPEGLSEAKEVLQDYKIEGLVVIGGDGSLRGGLHLAKVGVKVVGIPATIDNDLPFTDYSVGFDTSVNTVLSAIGNIRDTSSSHERCTIIEVMGRDCGDIALYTGLTGGAESILIPEVPTDIDEICKSLIQGKDRGKLHSVIIKAEGVNFCNHELAQIIEDRTGMETKIVVLGYIQRGGSPTARDRILATQLGYKSVELLLEEGISSKAVGIKGENIVSYDLEKALNAKRSHNNSLMELAEIMSR
jgi:6-phosphofructokinase 1